MDGADLASVYGSMYQGQGQGQAQAEQQPAMPAIAPAAQSHAQAPEVPYQPPTAMYANNNQVMNFMQEPSFWDRMASKKMEVLKMFVLALVVLLAISLDRVAMNYLTGYLRESILTTIQEFFVRISYPVLVVLMIWIIKAY